MEEDVVVQFTGFETNLPEDAFISLWEDYARQSMGSEVEIFLDQCTGLKCRFKYLSKNVWSASNNKLSFKRGSRTGNFPDGRTNVLQLGGYSAIQSEHADNATGKLVKLVICLSNEEHDVAWYKALDNYKFLNFYEAYYESCMYTHILEFFIHQKDLGDFIEHLQTHTQHSVAGTFKEAFVLNELVTG